MLTTAVTFFVLNLCSSELDASLYEILTLQLPQPGALLQVLSTSSSSAITWMSREDPSKQLDTLTDFGNCCSGYLPINTFWHLQSSFFLILKFTSFLTWVTHVIECKEIEANIKTAPLQLL